MPDPDNNAKSADDLNRRTGMAANERQVTIRDGAIKSRDLFFGGRELVITHGEDVYRLRLTSQNKLILTK